MNIFYTDKIIEKVIFSVFYVYIFNFITDIQFILLICTNFLLCREMAINVFVLLNILSDNSKY